MRLEENIEQRSQNLQSAVLDCLGKIVSAYIHKQNVALEDLPRLVNQVHGLLSQILDKGAFALRPALKPAVPVEKSVMDDWIICLEDGKYLKMLKRHLRALYNLTPEEYKAKWGLSDDYPMVAPSYAKERSNLAKLNGLGQAASLREVS